MHTLSHIIHKPANLSPHIWCALLSEAILFDPFDFGFRSSSFVLRDPTQPASDSNIPSLLFHQVLIPGTPPNELSSLTSEFNTRIDSFKSILSKFA